MDKKISVVVPVYREEGNIDPFLKRLIPVLKKTGLQYEIIFSLDPSPDNTEGVIQEQISLDSNIKALIFSRRFGQPAATMAGIFASTGDVCAVIDIRYAR